MQSHTLLILALLAIGCDNQVADKMTGETIKVGPLLLDRSMQYTHIFSIVNNTKHPISILSEHHSCACTQVAVKTGSLSPGETTNLRLDVNLYPINAKTFISCTL